MAGILMRDCRVARDTVSLLVATEKAAEKPGAGDGGQERGAAQAAGIARGEGETVVKSEEVRFMWLFVFFDLPVGTKTERRDATRFRNFLKDDGFMMLQFSVYARVCRGEEAVDKHLARVTKSLPPKGSVRTLAVTDRQYARMKLLVGEATKNEKVAPQQLVLL